MKSVPICLADIVGPVAEDKDHARVLRIETILPALERHANVVLDFKGVVVATQSFIHACISEAVQRYGENVLDCFEFRSCADEVRQVIATVVEYSLRAHELASNVEPTLIESIDIPQADSILTIRTILDAMANGNTYLLDLEKATGYSYRHLHYRLHAARILGLVRMGRTIAALTEAGFQLTYTGPHSEDERHQFAKAVQASRVLRKIAPGLLSKRHPDPEDIAKRIEGLTGMSHNTAQRRAHSIIAWRRQLLEPQQRLPFVAPQRRPPGKTE